MPVQALVTFWFHIVNDECSWVVVEAGLLELRAISPVRVQARPGAVLVRHAGNGQYVFKTTDAAFIQGQPEEVCARALMCDDAASILLVLKMAGFKATQDIAPNKSQQLTMRYNDLITPAVLSKEIELLRSRQGR